MTERLSESEDETIRRYESMPVEEIEAELREQGIDPRPTIEAVQKLVREALARRGS